MPGIKIFSCGKFEKEGYCLKDLKHLIYFENLLQDAQNELVTKAVEEGKFALGYNCYYVPEVLLNLPGCFSSRLRAPRCVSTDLASGAAARGHARWRRTQGRSRRWA